MAAQVVQEPTDSGPSDDRPLSLGPWTESYYPGTLPIGCSLQWLQGVPGRLVEHLKRSPDSPGDAIVLPFAGRDDASSLESILHAQAPELSPRVLAFDSSPWMTLFMVHFALQRSREKSPLLEGVRT